MGCTGDQIGDYYRGNKGDTRSLDYSSYKVDGLSSLDEDPSEVSSSYYLEQPTILKPNKTCTLTLDLKPRPVLVEAI